MDQISGLNQHARSCSTIILSNSSLNTTQKQPATASRNDLSGEDHLFAKTDLTNTVGIIFNVLYFGAVPLQNTLSCKRQTPEALAQLVESCIRRVRIALMREQGYGDLLQDDSPPQNISQFMGEANTVRAVEVAIASVSTKHFTLILSSDAYKMQFDIEKVSYARSNLSGFCAVIAKNKDQNRVCIVIRSEHCYDLVKALNQVFDMQVTARKSVHVKKEQPENVVENEQVPQDKADSNSTLNSCTASLDGSGEKYAPWYHGPLSRTDAEKLILKDGDFLVRESTSIHGQVVLSSMHKGKHEHLLMIDPTDGNVRDMQGKVYPTVHDFIEHHCLNGQQVQFNNNLFLRLSMPVFSTNSLTLKK